MLHRNGSLLEFYEGWLGKRTFPVDMAAFAVNVRHFVKVILVDVVVVVAVVAAVNERHFV